MITKKKPYTQPLLAELTREQVLKKISDNKGSSEEEAVRLLDSLVRQKLGADVPKAG